MKWKRQQKKKSDDLKSNLLTSFQKILSDLNNENLSKEILKYILIAFKKQVLAKETTKDKKLRKYLRESWGDTYTAANYAYKESFYALNIDAVRKYLDDPIEYMSDLFNNDYAIYSETLVNSILREIEEYYENTKKNLLKGIAEWSAQFDSNQKYQLQLSKFLLYLSVKKTAPENDLSKILVDVKNLFGSVTIEKPVDFCNILKKIIIEGLEDVKTAWDSTERSETKKRLKTYLKVKISFFNRIGCSARCPCCSSKCELPDDDDHTVHQATKHFIPAFAGVRDRDTRYPSLIICAEDEAHDQYLWGKSEDLDFLPIHEFLKKYHPSWLPFPRLEPSDEHITKMRAIWWKLKDELCEKYEMIDNTDPSWGARYGSLIPE
jgi:hypothetical protein